MELDNVILELPFECTSWVGAQIRSSNLLVDVINLSSKKTLIQ